jgi:hypothetical protein
MLVASFREGASRQPVATPPSALCPAVKLGLRHCAPTSLRGVQGGSR